MLLFQTESMPNRFSSVFLIDTSTVETINTGLKDLAMMKNIGQTSDEAQQWLTRNEGWLLFFDNADDPKINLNDFLPQCNHGNVIITSRNPDVQVHAARHGLYTEVSDMEETEAIALLLERALQEDSAKNRITAAEIVKVGHCFISSLSMLNIC